MALELRPNREYCDRDLPPTSTLAWICSYECIFCSDCVLLDSHTVIAGRISAVECVGCTSGFHTPFADNGHSAFGQDRPCAEIFLDICWWC